MEIETRPDGRPSLVYVNRPRPESWRPNPWGFAPGGRSPERGQAATLTESEAATATWDTMLDLAGADWQVEARRTFTERLTPDANGKRALMVPDERTLVRTGGRSGAEVALRTVSDSYGVVQNHEVTRLLAQVGMTPDSLAVMDDGRSLYAQSVVSDLEVRAGDTGKVRQFRTAFWSHGLGAVKTGRTRWGIVCANTYGHALSDVDVRIRHSRHASAAVARLARSLEREASEAKEWATLAQRMAETDGRRVLGPMTVSTSRGGPETPVATLLATAVAGEATKYSDLHARSQGVVDDVLAIVRRADPRTGVVGDGSLWDLFQAASYYTSHERTVRGQSGAAAEVARRVGETPDWLGATWDALAAIATDAAPVLVTRA